MVGLLKLIVELNPEQAIFEVLHELLVVNPLRAIYIGSEGKRYDLTLIEAKGSELAQALDVLEWFQEAFVVFIELAEHLEQVQIGVLGHIHVLLSEGAKLHKLSLASTCLNREHLWDNFTE